MAELFTITGRVVRGDGYGRKIGFPTANIDRRQWSRLKVKPKLGVYAGAVTLSIGRKYKAGIVVGPIDRKGLPRLEAHLLKFKGNLYGKKITIELVKFLHQFRKYKSETELRKGIAEDMRQVNKIIKL